MDTLRISKISETYIQVDCEPGIAYELSDYFTFDVPGAKFSPAFRNKFWDGKIRLYNVMNRLLYAGLVPYVQKFCKDRDYECILESDFDPVEFSVAEAKEFIGKLNVPFEVRDYQLETFVHAVRHKRALLISPTSSGKSLIIYLIMRYLQRKTLIIVPTTSLVHQMASDFEDYGLRPGLVHRIISGQEKETSKGIVVSTWQSIYKLPKSWFSQFDVVFGDECHLFKAKCLTEIMTKLPECEYRFGLTGTLDGTLTNKLVLEGLFGALRQVTTTKKLMDEGHVSQLSIKAIVLKYSDDLRQQCTKFDYQSEIEFLYSYEKRNRFIRNLVLSLEGNTLILFERVEHGKALFEMIKKKTNRPVYYISGEVDASAREEIRAIVEKESDAVVVASMGTTSTGVNMKRLNNLIFASPSKSIIRVLQSIGRALRLSKHKDGATLYDIADDLSWKSKKNYTVLHFIERINIYAKEQFNYKIYPVSLK